MSSLRRPYDPSFYYTFINKITVAKQCALCVLIINYKIEKMHEYVKGRIIRSAKRRHSFLKKIEI
jgi:hypothetical protein